MFEVLVDALMFALASAAFAGLMLMMETFISTLVDPHRIDRVPSGSSREKTELALRRA